MTNRFCRGVFAKVFNVGVTNQFQISKSMLIALLVGKRGIVDSNIFLLDSVRRKRNHNIAHIRKAKFWSLTAKVAESNFSAKFFATEVDKQILWVNNLFSCFVQIKNNIEMRYNTKTIFTIRNRAQIQSSGVINKCTMIHNLIGS